MKSIILFVLIAAVTGLGILLYWLIPMGPATNYQGMHLDIGPRLHQEGRPATWSSSRMRLGQSNCEAAIGPARYKDKTITDTDYDYYSIDIEMLYEKDICLVLFQRELPLAELPKDILTKKVQDVVSYDNRSQLVTFIIGKQRFQYKLPNRQQVAEPDRKHVAQVGE